MGIQAPAFHLYAGTLPLLEVSWKWGKETQKFGYKMTALNKSCEQVIISKKSMEMFTG